MATRGYFTIKNLDDQKNPYIGKDDLLIEAYHDGYFYDVLQDILSVPFLIHKIQSHGYGQEFMCMTFYLKKEKSNKELFLRSENFEKFIFNLKNLCIYDLTWNSYINLLNFTCPFKYNQISSGVHRYGHPVSKDYSFFEIFHTATRIDTVTLKILKNVVNEDDLDEIGSLIERLNKYITSKDYKIIFDEKRLEIKFSVIGIILDLIYHNSPHIETLEDFYKNKEDEN